MTEQVFVAREREMAQLQTFLDHALAGQGQVCFVTGEAGAGKTALVTEFARRAQDANPDLIVAVGQGDAQTGAGDPYLPFREVLGLLTGDVEAKLAQGAITQENAGRLRDFIRVSGQALVEYGPDLIDIFVPGGALATRAAGRLAQRTGWLERLEELTARRSVGSGDTDPSTGPSPGSGGASGQALDQSRIFEQYTNVVQALAAQQPLLLVLDDLQWADAASINLLFRLGRRIAESHILIVGAYRPDDVALGRRGERHPLEPVLNELKRYHGDVWIDLGEAEEIEGRQFVDAFLDTELNRLGSVFRQALFQHTGGHPLFTIELLRDMQERGDLIRDEKGSWVEGPALDWRTLPARVEGVVEERIGRLEEELRDILTVASVEGEDFTAQVVAQVQDIRERQLIKRLVNDLDKRHRLISERGLEKWDRRRLYLYRFRHHIFQHYLYHNLSEVERELLHGDIAEVLEELYAGHTEEITVQLARHYAEAGEGERAVHYLLQAGDKARGLYAHQEAIDHYQRALAFLKQQDEYELAARTLMKLGLTYHNAFDFRRARQAYDEGFALWQRAGQIQPAVPPPRAPHALRMNCSDPLTLDPTMSTDFSSAPVIDHLFSGLVELTPEMDVVPDAARTWEVLEDGQRYVFHLRDDVRWSDGTVTTAGDFEYAWKRLLDPTTGSPVASLLYDVKGARAFHQGEVTDPDHVGVRALDEGTLVVELEGPTGYFLQLLTHSVCYPVPRHVVEAHREAWTEVGNIVTNGPFRLEAWHRGESMILSRNPAYPGRFTGNAERVELSSSGTPSALLATYEADRLDVLDLYLQPPPEIDRARQRHAGEYVSAPAVGLFYLAFDVSQPPFDDVRVRRAFALAADRETLADVVWQGFVFPATGGFVPPGMPGHVPGISSPYDPERARQLLAEAGYPGGRGFPVVELPVWHTRASFGEFLLAQWRENLGVEIAPETMEWEAYVDMVYREPPAMWLMGWRADYPDPDNFLRVGFPHDRTGWRNEAYDRLVEQARRVTDQAERMNLYERADRVLVEEAVIIPLAYHRSHLLVKPWVSNHPTSPIRTWFWKDVVIEPH